MQDIGDLQDEAFNKRSISVWELETLEEVPETPNTVELIPTLGALSPPEAGPSQTRSSPCTHSTSSLCLFISVFCAHPRTIHVTVLGTSPR